MDLSQVSQDDFPIVSMNSWIASDELKIRVFWGLVGSRGILTTSHNDDKLGAMNNSANNCRKLRQRVIALCAVFSFLMFFANPVIAACAPSAEGCCCENGDSELEGESLKRGMSCCESDCECAIEAPNPTPATPVEAMQSGDMSPLEAPGLTQFGEADLKISSADPGHVTQRGPPPSHWPPLYIQYDSYLI